MSDIGTRGPKKGEGGRPRVYDGEGAPQLTVRLAPEDRDWVREQGGAGWLRRMIGELRELSKEKRFAQWWNRLKSPPADEE